MTNRFRKKGSIILLSLLMIMAVALIAAIFINLSMSYEGLNRVQNAADMGAKLRAQAVDIALKERTGFIETLHDQPGSYVNDNVPGRSTIPVQEDGYTHSIYRTNSTEYLDAEQDANGITQRAISGYIEDNVGSNTSGDPQIEIKPENVCISVRALPSSTSSTMNFSCSATVNGTTVMVEANNVPVNGTDHPVNIGPDGSKVMNVVFVGIAYEHKHFIYNAIQKVFHGNDVTTWDQPPVRTTWSTAYPQIDACAGNHEC
jgi:hypothetical protein